MIDRRAFLSGLAWGALATGPAAGGAQETSRRPRIGFLLTVPRASLSDRLDAFEEGLRELGYVDGDNITVVYRSAEGRHERLPALAAELVASKVDVIVTTGQPVPDAALKATRSIPIEHFFSAIALGSRFVPKAEAVDRPDVLLERLAELAMHLFPFFPSEQERFCERRGLEANLRDCERFDGLSNKADGRRVLAAPIRVIAGFEATGMMANRKLRQRLQVRRGARRFRAEVQPMPTSGHISWSPRTNQRGFSSASTLIQDTERARSAVGACRPSAGA